MKPMTIRWILVGLSALLAVVLIASGYLVIGGVIAAMAVARACLLVSVRRRRREWAERFSSRGAGNRT